MRRSLLLFTAVPAAGLVAIALLTAPTTTPIPSSTAAAVPEQAPPSAASALMELPEFTGVTAEAEDIALEVSLDRSSVMVGTDGLVRAEVTLRSDHPRETGHRVPTDLVVVMDTSGSMDGAKMSEAKQAARELLASLGSEDRFSLVQYSGRAHVEIPLTLATTEARQSWQAQIDGLSAHGSTNMQDGLDIGAAVHSPQASRARRTILISDGLPDTSHGLVDQARSSARAETPLTTVGIGDDYDELLMSQLADAGTGNFYWVRPGHDLARIFADELSTANETVASAVTIQHAPLGGVELVGAAGYEVIDGGFSVGSLYAGQERKLWVTFRVPAGSAAEDLQIGQLTASWKTPGQTELAHAGVNLPVMDVVDNHAQYIASIDSDSWGRSVVTEDYNRMRAEVSQRVQAGDKDGALDLIDDYTLANGTLNEDVNCDAVWDNLDEVADLRVEVEGNFAGDNQAERQNIFSKALNYSSYSTRRSGQAKGY